MPGPITQPREIAELKGADKKNPQRYRNEVPKNSNPVGLAPEDMTPEQQKCYFELTSYAIPNVLTQADSTIVELAASLLAEFRKDRSKFPANKIGHLMSCLTHLGMTPSARTKLNVSKEKPKNPYSDDALDA
jgi:hypothetical protein